MLLRHTLASSTLPYRVLFSGGSWPNVCRNFWTSASRLCAVLSTHLELDVRATAVSGPSSPPFLVHITGGCCPTADSPNSCAVLHVPKISCNLKMSASFTEGHITHLSVHMLVSYSSRNCFGIWVPTKSSYLAGYAGHPTCTWDGLGCDPGPGLPGPWPLGLGCVC